MKTSIRNIAATAADFVTFAHEVASSDLDDRVKGGFSDLAGRMSDAIRVTAETRKAEDISTVNMHRQWQDAQAPKLVELCHEARGLLKDNERALSDVVANSKMPEHGRIRAIKLIGALDSIELSENSTKPRDAGAYWNDPLYGVQIEDSI